MSVFLREPAIAGLETGGIRLFVEEAEPFGPVLELFADDLEEAKSGLVQAGCTIEIEYPCPEMKHDSFGLIFNVAPR